MGFATRRTWQSRTNLLFSFEKMAVRNAVKSPTAARAFARGLYEMLYGPGDAEHKFGRWCEVIGGLLDLAAVVRRDLRDLKPRDLIDGQSFLWVQGSEEYPD